MNSLTSKELFKETGCMSLQSLILYRDGKLSPGERHLMEQHLIDCPLCSDALEGIHSMKSTSMINEINGMLQQPSANSVIPPFAKHFAIAASLAAIALLTWFAYQQFSSINTERMAIQTEVRDDKVTNEIIPPLSVAPPPPPEQNVPSSANHSVQPVMEPLQQQFMVPDVAVQEDDKAEEFVSGATMENNTDALTAEMVNTTTNEQESMNHMASKPMPVSNEPERSVSTGTTTPAPVNNGSPVVYVHDLKIIRYPDPVIRKMELNNKNTPAVYQNREKKAEIAVAEDLENQRSQQYEELIGPSLLHYKKGQYNKAISGFDQLLTIRNNDQNALFYKAMSYYQLKNNLSAIALFKPLSDDVNSPFMEEAMFYMAKAYSNTGNKTAADDLFRRLIRLDGFYREKAEGEVR